ncbi:SRPBCC family protein [Nocardioides sp. cx-173]|uniref:SRPBCC family protein n=1 Tax=Nocardioides sp. cx-173 TaxID=2898796 RepID=UPI001E43D0DE|nr:SRPBCC family protein [Nocardioides sp. cx-173]MCD4526453.1 SRPBCC family protein [Nocardioides sp. cx-173]UGB41142.1 SRPBCC family protein [Nocardioides sp. cx-173]
MDLTHRFTVPTGVEQTWAQFQDIASVAECFPGATVSSVESDTFQGSCKVKLGPIALVYNGSGTFVERDEAAHRFVVDAKGKDRRGNGTAGAVVTCTMTASPTDPAGATEVEVVTDLHITGKPAQFGRGVMQDVSDKLLGQFVDCLEQRLSPAAAAPEVEAAAEAEVAGEAEPEPEPTPLADAAAAAASQPSPVSPPEPTARPPRPQPADQEHDDALDLGATVVPILLKTYWRQALGGAVVLVLLRRLLRRLRG